MVDKDDMVLKDRIAGPKAIRDQATADAERTQDTLDSVGSESISLDMIDDFSRTAREGLRLESGGYRRDHLRAFAQRVEVADDEVRTMGSKSELLSRPGSRFERRIGGVWRSQFCTEMARHTGRR